jgi:hypothetical protein
MELPAVGTTSNPQLQWLRAAKLITPFPWFGITARSVWQRIVFGNLVGYVSNSDLSGYDPLIDWRLYPGHPHFPYGLIVEPD